MHGISARIIRLAALGGLVASLACGVPAIGAEPAPRPKPAPSPFDPPKQPVKRSHFCAAKENGWYCGEQGEPRLFFCKEGLIQDAKDCSNGCDERRRACKPAG